MTTTSANYMETNYSTAVHWLNNNMIMFNQIHDIDPDFWESEAEQTYNEETEEYNEIYQYYLTDCTDDEVEWLRTYFPGLLFAYSEFLGNWVLLVDHYGTAWDYVTTETTLQNAVCKLGETK